MTSAFLEFTIGVISKKSKDTWTWRRASDDGRWGRLWYSLYGSVSSIAISGGNRVECQQEIEPRESEREHIVVRDDNFCVRLAVNYNIILLLCLC